MCKDKYMDRGVDWITVCTSDSQEENEIPTYPYGGILYNNKKNELDQDSCYEKKSKVTFMCKLKPSWYESILLKMQKRQTFMVRRDTHDF